MAKGGGQLGQGGGLGRRVWRGQCEQKTFDCWEQSQTKSRSISRRSSKSREKWSRSIHSALSLLQLAWGSVAVTTTTAPRLLASSHSVPTPTTCCIGIISYRDEKTEGHGNAWCLEPERQVFDSQLCHFLTVWPWTRYVVVLCLNLFVCKTET